ncbi:MAG: hypothetical protein EOP51_27730 [Sphingobacteriales bacterium]|nr:MAG: hypothetical protein EOP51_27730 [Sphingobacteriales bacterium]
MKRFLLFILTFSFQSVIAQSVGVGTTDPAPSAVMDVVSTQKGFLIPRMTQLQRIAIASPENGLLVFDNTSQRLYQYQAGVWRAIINSEYWTKPVSGRDWMYNTGDSVGIGTAAPTEKLHVAGKVRATAGVVSGGDIDAAGVIEGAGLVSNGALFITAASLFQGAITANGSINANNGVLLNGPTGTITYRSGTDKAFVQLSDDNLRLGTNSGNTNGKVVVRTQGADQVNIDSDGINLVNNGKVQTLATGQANLIPACYGSISTTGSILSGTGNFTIVRSDLGKFDLSSSLITANSIIVVTVGQCIPDPISVGTIKSPASCRVILQKSAGGLVDCRFDFVVFNY